MQALPADRAGHRGQPGRDGGQRVSDHRQGRGATRPRHPRRRGWRQPLPPPPGVQGGDGHHAQGVRRCQPRRTGARGTAPRRAGERGDLRCRVRIDRALLRPVQRAPRHDPDPVPRRCHRRRNALRRRAVLARRGPRGRVGTRRVRHRVRRRPRPARAPAPGSFPRRPPGGRRRRFCQPHGPGRGTGGGSGPAGCAVASRRSGNGLPGTGVAGATPGTNGLDGLLCPAGHHDRFSPIGPGRRQRLRRQPPGRGHPLSSGGPHRR
jgi:hypothetical protein